MDEKTKIEWLFDYVNFIMNKDQSSGTLSPEEFNTMLRAITWKRFYELYKEWELNQQIGDSLAPFVILMDEENPLNIPATGIAIKPDNYYHSISATYLQVRPNNVIKRRDVDFVTHKEFSERVSHPTEMPTLKNPIAVNHNGNIRFEPRNLGTVIFEYFKVPATPVYDYYYSSDGVTYIFLDPNTTYTLLEDEEGPNGETAGTILTSRSTELEWNFENVIKIAAILLGELGMNIREDQLLNYAQLMKQENTER